MVRTASWSISVMKPSPFLSALSLTPLCLFACPARPRGCDPFHRTRSEHDLPATFLRDRRKAAPRVHRYRMSHEFQEFYVGLVIRIGRARCRIRVPLLEDPPRRPGLLR